MNNAGRKGGRKGNYAGGHALADGRISKTATALAVVHPTLDDWLLAREIYRNGDPARRYCRKAKTPKSSIEKCPKAKIQLERQKSVYYSLTP